MGEKASSFFGIDFGTTCSAVAGAHLVGGQSVCEHYGDTQGRPVQSAVAVHRETGETIVGRGAIDAKAEQDEQYELIPSVKRRLGTDWHLDIGSTRMDASDIARVLFQDLRRLAEEQNGFQISDVIVAIPVGFSPRGRQELRHAAEAAGFRILSFVSEPTAAFFANYDALRHAGTVVVFDWGGGTLDVSVLRHEDGRVGELAVSGMERAGNDIDEMLARYVHTRVCEKAGNSIAYEDVSPKSRHRLLSACEQAKRQFTEADSAVVRVNNYEPVGPLRMRLEYEDFSRLISPVIRDAMGCLENALSQTGLSPEALDTVLLTGGSCGLRPLQEEITGRFGDRVLLPSETAWNVAEGAAALATQPGRYRSAQRIGLVLSDDSYFPLLEPNEPLDGWACSHTFGLADDTEQARIVFSGSADIDADATGKNTLPFPAYNFLQEMIRLDAEVDQDHVFRVRASSNMRPDTFARVWEYPNLKTYYEIAREEDPDD